MEESQIDQDYELYMLLAQTRHALLRARLKELRKYGIARRDAGVLVSIQRLGEKAIPAEIARCLFLEPHTVSARIHRMQQDGLVQKVKDRARKNLVRVAMTDRGQQAQELCARRESIHKVFSALTDDEKEQLLFIMRKLRHGAIQELGMPEPPWPRLDGVSDNSEQSQETRAGVQLS
jgi:DNA-binding MarR family transcriptional regulator